MHNKKYRDRIDTELSKTYFGNLGNKKNEINTTAKTPTGKTPPKIINSSIVREKFLSTRNILFLALLILFISITVRYALMSFSPRAKAGIKKTAALAPIVPKTTAGNIVNKKILLSSGDMENNKKPPQAEPKMLDEKILYNFEKNSEGWEIPGWEADKTDHMARTLKHISGFASSGNGCIELLAEFPGVTWAGALIETEYYVDMSDYDLIAADIYLPADAPKWIRGKIVITTGENWDFIEMMRPVKLAPGKWTLVTADISEKSMDWKKTKMNRSIKKDVRKIAIRIESERTPYYGAVYIDNIRVARSSSPDTN